MTLPSISKFTYLCLLSIIFLTSSCCKDEFKLVKVDFFIEHPGFMVMPAVFDTLREEVLLTEGYNVGATFETVTEETLVAEEHTIIELTDVEYFTIIGNAEYQLECEVPCVEIYNSGQFKSTVIPNTYEIRYFQKVLENGSGDFVEATYGERFWLRLATDAMVIEGNEPMTVRKNFIIPVDIDFDTYWQQQLTEQGATGCSSSSNYKIVE